MKHDSKAGRLSLLLALPILVLILVFAVSCMTKRSGINVTARDELRSEIKATVSDPVRADAMLAAIDGMIVAIEKLDQTVSNQRKELYSQIREYSTSRQTVEETLMQHMEKRQVILDELLKYHYEFKSLTTVGEWKKLKKKEKKLLTTTAQAIRDRSGMKGDL